MKAEEKAQELYPNNKTFCGGVAQIARDAFAKGARMQKEVDDKELSEKVSAAYQLGLSDKEKQMAKGLEEEINRTYYDGSVTDTSDLDHNSYENIARHFAQWGAEHFRDLTKKMGDSSEIPNRLNEIADYARRQVEEILEVIKKYDDYSCEQIEELRTHLMAMFLEGAGWQKKQMMKEAVEADVNIYRDIVAGKSWAEFVAEMPTNNLGEKVRIIIVREEKDGTERA